MKVLQVVPGMSPAFGGPSVALADLGRALAGRGIETSLFTTNVDPAGRLEIPVNVPVSQAGASIVYHDVWPSGRYSFSLPLARALRQNIPSFDVIHVHWLYNFSSLASAVLARRAGVPYVLQFNGSLDPHLMRKNTAVKRAYWRLAGRFIVDNAAALIFTSEAERRQAAFGPLRPPSFIVPVGLHWGDYVTLPPRGEFRRRFPAIPNGPMVLFLGRISPQKGLDLLVPAFRTVLDRYPNAHLVLAGPDGEGHGGHVRKWLSEYRIEDHVTMLGRVPDDAKLALYVDCDVFVLPSYAENFGATVTEALACKRPIVISDRVNICDEISAADAGIVVPCSPDAVADGICQVLGDPAGAEGLASRGRDLVRRRYTWDAALEALLPVYEAAIQTRVRHRQAVCP